MNPPARKRHPGWRTLTLLVFALGLCALQAADDPPVNDRIMFDDIRVNDQPVRLAFDTGASDIMVYRPVAERLGLKITEPSADTKLDPGEVRFGTTAPVEFQFGTGVFAVTVTGVLAVVDLPTGVRPEEDGVIGWDNLRNNYFVFDAANSKMSLVAPRKPPEPAAWQSLPLRKNSETLVLEIPGSKDQPGGILIDTGAPDGVFLSPARWREWRAAHSTAPTTMDAYFTPGAGLVVREVSWAKELAIGPLILTNVTVQETSPVETALISGHEATLGVAALKRQDMMIDGKNGMAYFARRQIPTAPFSHNRLGAVFTPSDLQHDPLEAHVATGTPADTAG